MDKDKQARMVALANAIERGNWNRDTKEEFRRLVGEAVAEQLQPVLNDLERQLPALQAAVNRRRAAIEAGRRAGTAAGRQVQQRYMSEAQRQARDRILHQQRKR